MTAALLALSALPFRPPAVPLVTHSPYVSVWSMADRLTEEWPRHWTRGINAMCGLVTIDGRAYRWMGPDPQLGEFGPVPPMEQVGLEVTATRSVYQFRADGVELTVEFCSPLLADDVELLARPATYVTFSARTLEGAAKRVRAYLDATAEWVVADASSPVLAGRSRREAGDVLQLRGARSQPLSRSGDQVRIDWGTLFLTGPGVGVVAADVAARTGFLRAAKTLDDLRFPRRASDEWPVIGFGFDLGAQPETVVLAYDEEYAVTFFDRPLRPYWNRADGGPGPMIDQARRDVAEVRARCAEFDRELAEKATAVGGPEYADIVSLAYRQCLAGHGLAYDFSEGLLMFSKENTSNGCIATVDVTFPASPFFLLLNPNLLKAQLDPVFVYAASPRWRFPFAPHDLGTYPLANGQVYGGGERDETNQMPVEESANMILMAAGVCRTEGSYAYARRHWPLLTRWADYLAEHGLDPASQLSTDDFTGHLARNANLSIKAILAVRAYAEMAEGLGEAEVARTARVRAEAWAAEWTRLAAGGDPTVLAFGQAGTWSLKYNLLWDRLLGYGLFPRGMIDAELAAYSRHANEYGTPLDNRASFTKTDWLMWVAALADDRPAREAMVKAVHRWLNATPDRVPFSDWYDTVSGRTMGMHTRTVIGGVFAPMLAPLPKVP